METKEIDLTGYPSIVQSRRHGGKTSKRYAFVSTLKVAGVLKQNGWVPVEARETRARRDRGYQKHEVRFRSSLLNRQLMVGEEIPEIVLQNSHMGSAPFLLMAGLHRCVCANQLCVPAGIVEERRIRHVGYADQLVHEALQGIVGSIPKTLESVERYKAIPLSSQEREAFAKAAIELRFDGEKFAVAANDILQKRRSDVDDGLDLWTTFNLVQENVIKGGILTLNRSGNRRSSQAVQGIDESTRLNRGLWSLADAIARRKANIGSVSL